VSAKVMELEDDSERGSPLVGQMLEVRRLHEHAAPMRSSLGHSELRRIAVSAQVAKRRALRCALHVYQRHLLRGDRWLL